MRLCTGRVGQSPSGWGMRKNIRDNTRHDSLIIAEQKDAQGNKHARKVPGSLSTYFFLLFVVEPTYNNAFPVRPRGSFFPVMMTVRTFSTRPICLGAGFGISIASLSTPGLVVLCSR